MRWNLRAVDHIQHLKLHQLAYASEQLISHTVTWVLTGLRTYSIINEELQDAE